MSTIEQRGATRFRFLGFAALPCEITSGSKSWPGLVTNASETGLGIEMNALADELSSHTAINIHLHLDGKALSINGRPIHIQAQDKFRKIKLGTHLANTEAGQTLHKLCCKLADCGRATGHSLSSNFDQEYELNIHGALSLKTVTDAINIISTQHISRLNFSDCLSDGKLGAQLGLVAVAHGVAISGCDTQLSPIMRQAKVCTSCHGC